MTNSPDTPATPEGDAISRALGLLAEWEETPNEGDPMIDVLLGVIREVHGLLRAHPAATASAGKVKALAEAAIRDCTAGAPISAANLARDVLSALQPGDGWQGIESAATALLNDKAAFARMVDAAEEIHETGASFNVVIGDALRAASLPQGEETR